MNEMKWQNTKKKMFCVDLLDCVHPSSFLLMKRTFADITHTHTHTHTERERERERERALISSD